MNRLLKALASLTLFAAITTASAQGGQLEIFSWWAGDEGPALEALIDLYEAQNPGVDVINATVTGGAGVDARAVLRTRMLGGDPPDTFQVHAGQGLISSWVAAGRMEDLSFLYDEEGLRDVFPADLIDLISTDDGIWTVPVNIHRSNVLWYVPANLEGWGVSVPNDWEEFLAVCPDLQAQGVTPLVVAEGWTQQHLWESVALGVLGTDDYNRLWTGELRFDAPEALEVWETFGAVMDCTNPDADGLSWQQATDRLVEGDAAFNIMGDWAAGYMTTTLGLEPGEGYGWAASPGTEGSFMMLSDSFGLPVGAPNRENVVEWLRMLGSQEGQDTFNPLKGSIAARTDSDLSLYNAYLQSAAGDFAQNRLVPSLVHGAAANPQFQNEFATVLNIYLDTGSAQAAANAAQTMATQTNLGN
jgi:glucose/mannose transport system substrate-binding protein